VTRSKVDQAYRVYLASKETKATMAETDPPVCLDYPERKDREAEHAIHADPERRERKETED
jgi:hypothetical protein